jgi:hypothetical protein
MSATVVTPTNVTAHDRLGITLFLAIAFHVAIILGITFNINRDGDEKQNRQDEARQRQFVRQVHAEFDSRFLMAEDY